MKIENTLKLDQETDLKLGLIDSPPWGNPKINIHGIYKRGLINSLEYFGNRGRLIIWPDPKNPTRYINLNGNQRFSVFMDHYNVQFIAEEFNLPAEFSNADILKIKSDSSNLERLNDIKRKIYEIEVGVQIVTHIKPGRKMTAIDAMAFCATWDRNHAAWDESRLAEQSRLISQELLKNTQDILKVRKAKFLQDMIRPEKVFLMPKPEMQAESNTEEGFQYAKEGEYEPTEDEPFGPLPPANTNDYRENHKSTSNKIPTQLIPLVLSLTPEGYQEITNKIIRSKSHLFREKRLLAGLDRLQELTESVSDITDSIVVELSLLLLNRNIEVAEEKKLQNSS